MILISPILQMIAFNGVAIRMEAGAEMEVRESLVETALAAGCLKVGPRIRASSKAVDPEPALTTPNAVDAVALLVEEANPKDFDRNGMPKVRSVERVLGSDINAADRDVAWETFQKEG